MWDPNAGDSKNTTSWKTCEESFLSDLHESFFFLPAKNLLLLETRFNVKSKRNPAKQMSSNADLAKCFWTAGSYHMAENMFPDFNPQLTCFLHATRSAGKKCFVLWAVKWSSSITVHLIRWAYCLLKNYTVSQTFWWHCMSIVWWRQASTI